jgi:hypothetical protein
MIEGHRLSSGSYFMEIDGSNCLNIGRKIIETCGLYMTPSISKGPHEEGQF